MQSVGRTADREACPCTSVRPRPRPRPVDRVIVHPLLARCHTSAEDGTCASTSSNEEARPWGHQSIAASHSTARDPLTPTPPSTPIPSGLPGRPGVFQGGGGRPNTGVGFGLEMGLGHSQLTSSVLRAMLAAPALPPCSRSLSASPPLLPLPRRMSSSHPQIHSLPNPRARGQKGAIRRDGYPQRRHCPLPPIRLRYFSRGPQPIRFSSTHAAVRPRHGRQHQSLRAQGRATICVSINICISINVVLSRPVGILLPSRIIREHPESWVLEHPCLRVCHQVRTGVLDTTTRVGLRLFLLFCPSCLLHSLTFPFQVPRLQLDPSRPRVMVRPV